MNEISDLPFTLDTEKWGEILKAYSVCEGIYYIVMKQPERLVGSEYYIVQSIVVPKIVSHEVACIGKWSEQEEVYAFEYMEEAKGWELVEREIIRYQIRQGMKPTLDTNLYEIFVYHSDLYPDYFGPTIPPRYTPWGLTTRWKRAGNGVFLLETDSCIWVLALSYAVWGFDLSEMTKKYGQKCELDMKMGREEAAFLYFQEERFGPVFHELLQLSDYQGLTQYIQSKEALETYLTEQFLEYTFQYNYHEVAGHGIGDLLTNLVRRFGVELEETETAQEKAQRRINRCIHYYPELSGVNPFILP